MTIHKLPPAKRYPSYVYAMLCEDEQGPGYMKIGRTGDIAQRYASLVVGCPLPIKMIALLQVRTSEWSEIVEKAFHVRLGHRNTRGEWFRFDFRSVGDKAEFNAVTRQVLELFPRYILSKQWEVIDILSLERSDVEARERLIGGESDFQKKSKARKKHAKVQNLKGKVSFDRDKHFQDVIEIARRL